MSIYRAISSCPNCSHEDEVWFYYGKVSPTPEITCEVCSQEYFAEDFITCLLALRTNSSISAKHLQE